MSELYQFASGSPALTIILAFVLVLGLEVVLSFILKVYRQTLRSMTIMRHGYPPIWCDADGDFKAQQKPADAGKESK